VWCALAHESAIDPFFFNEDTIALSSFLDKLENCAVPQLNNNKNLILQLDGAPLNSADIARDCLKVNSPGR
jgi:hypothetical protein